MFVLSLKTDMVKIETVLGFTEKKKKKQKKTNRNSENVA